MQTRGARAEAINLTKQEAETVEADQPFHLLLISALAGILMTLTLTRGKGLPLGVTSPTWTSPGIWPTKEEFKGEAFLLRRQGQLLLRQGLFSPSPEDFCGGGGPGNGRRPFFI